MKILLLRPVNTAEGNRKEKEEDTFKYRRTGESLALGYLAASLESKGFDVDIIDGVLQNVSNKEIKEIVDSRKYHIIGFSCNVYADLVNNLRIVDSLESAEDLFIIFGGHVATFLDEYILKRSDRIKCVIRYEGEYPLCKVVSALHDKHDWRTIENLSYLDGSNLYRNPTFALHQGYTDELPFPRRDTINLLKNKATLINVCTSRGCYGNCTFCSVSSFYHGRGSKWSGRSPENVVEELKKINTVHGFHNFLFVDDNYVGPGKRGIERIDAIADLIMSNHLEIYYATNFRANDVIRCKDILPKLRESGLSYVFLGTESGCDSQLEFFNKQISTSENKQAVELLDYFGIGVTQGLIIFDYRISLEELCNNLRYARSTEGVNAGKLYSKLLVYHGTDLFKDVSRMEIQSSELQPVDVEFIDKKVAAVYSTVLNTLSWGAELYNTLEDMFWDCSFKHRIPFPRILKDKNNKVNHRLIDYMIEVIAHINEGKDTSYIDNDIVSFIINESLSIHDFAEKFEKLYR